MNCTFPRCGCSEREQCRPVKTAPALDLTQFEGHTPGPWWTDARYSEEECGCAIIAARTDCGPLPGNPTRGMVAWAQELLPENKERCAANARLIAAAPDLLAAYKAALARAEAAEANLNSGRELLREAWSQLNAIRAWRGAPPGVSEDWFSPFVDDLGDLLKDDRLPWMTAATKALVAPYRREIEQAQDRAIKAERERDEWRQACLAHGEKAERAERQSREAFTAGAEAMREACLVAAEASYGFDVSIWLEETKQGMVARIAEAIVDAIRALPIPAQEK